MRQRLIAFGLIAVLGVSLQAEAQYVKATVASFATSGGTYVDVPGGTVSFTPASATDVWVLLFSARIMSSSTTPLGSVEARYLVNGVEHGMGGTENTPTPDQPGPWTSFYRVTGTMATQTVQVQLRDVAGTGTIERLQIVAFKLPEGADFHYSETESDTVVPTGFAVYESLTINPSSPGEYLVMGLMTGSEGPGTQALYIRFKDPGGNYWPPEHEPGVQVWDYYITPSQMFQSFFVARTQTLSGPATYELEVDGSSDPNSTVRYTRFMAFRTDAFENFESVEDLTASSATSSTPVVKSQLETTPPPIARDYIVLQHLSAAVPAGFTGLRQVGFEADNVVTMSYDHSQQSQFYTAGYAYFDAKTTDRVVTYENTFASSTANEVRAKESVIHVLRLPSTTYDAHRLIGFETGDLSEMAVAGGGASADGVTVRPGSGAYSLKEGSTSTLAGGLSPAIDTFAMRFSFMKPANPGGSQTLVQLRNGATNLWSLSLTSAGQLQVQQQEAIGLGTQTGFTVLEDNRWCTIRIVYDRAAGGMLRVFVFNAIDIDTTHSSAGSAVDTLDVSGAPNPNEYFYDDFLVASSSVPLPFGQIVRRGPNAAGSSSGFDTRVGSVNGFQNVDEVTPGGGGDADYNQHGANTVATDLYALQDSTPGPINAVKAMWRMQRANGGGSGTHDYVWRESGVTTSTEFVGLGLTWQTTEEIWTAPPSSGGSWTEAKLNGLELGASHNGTFSEDTFISWTTAMVDYRPVPRYRSIGTAGAYSTGTVSVARGAYTVHGNGTAWKSANRGRGDRFAIGGVNYTIAAVNSETELTLREPFEGATTSAAPYTISRQYSVLQTWSDCVTGTPASCSIFPVIGSDLVAENRSEVGIAYKDSPFTADVQIDTSVTDANHTITLTADPGNRHNGIPGTGALIDNSGNLTDAIRIRDDYVTVQFLEVSGGGDPGSDGVHIQGQTALANHVVVRNMLIHGQPQYGITSTSADLVLDAYNNIFYDNLRGIRMSAVLSANARLRILNNTIYNSTNNGISTAGGANVVLLRNNISHTTGGPTAFAVTNLDPASSHNLASDGSGTTHSPGTGGQDNVLLADVGFQNEPARDLHITPGSFAADAGADLSSIFSFDVDGGTRTVFWDVGADDLTATTEVDLVSFTARGLDGAVLVEWETASELDNLGFHVYRSGAPTGPFTRITAHLIPGLGSSPSGARYRFRDDGLANGVTYYYELEDVEGTGRAERHGPIAATPGVAPVDDPVSQTYDGAEARISGITFGDPSRNALRVVRRGRRGIVVELITEGLYAEPSEDGTLVLRVPDFEPVSEDGTPAIPVKRPWIDVGDKTRVDIVAVRASAVESLPAWPLAGAELAEVAADQNGTVRLSRRRGRISSGSSGEFPNGAARILETGYQGSSRRVRLELAPLIWDRSTGRLRLARRLEVQLAIRPSPDAERTTRRRRHDLERQVLARLGTERAGLYELRYEDLFVARRGRSLPVDSLRLSRLGKAVPFHVEPAAEHLAPGSRLYFVSPGGRENPYGREAVFELELGRTSRTMRIRSAPPSGEDVPFWWVRIDREENHYYQAGLVDAPDVWLWDLLLAPQSKGFSFQVSELAPALDPARLTVWLQGVSQSQSELDHHIRVYLNGRYLGETEWDGKRARVLELEAPAGVLLEGSNTLELENVGDTGAAYSMVMLDRFAIVYPRRSLEAESEGRPDRPGAARNDGRAFVLEVGGDAPVWLTGTDDGFRVEAETNYLVVDRDRVERPEVRNAAPSKLRESGRGADYLVIAPRSFRAAADPLLLQRRGEGLRVAFVDIESIYDEFGFGESRPEAMREFIRYAYQHWREPSLRYVVLAGDGTYDFEDFLETGVANQVPPYMTRTSYIWTASDPLLAAVNGDDELPDLAIGRLPASNAEELVHMVDKILAHERMPSWMQGPLVLVADNSDAAGDFAASADAIASGVLAGRDVRKLYLDRMGSSALRDAIHASFDEGSGLVSYMGHGGIHLWADENVFNLSDVDGLAPGGAETLVLTMNCLNGYFHFPYFDSLAESLIQSPGKGAIAVFSPSGLSLDEPAHRFHEILLRELVNRPHARLGDAVLAAQHAYADTGAFPELLTIYHLFGDPALRLR